MRAVIESLQNGRVQHIRLLENEAPVSYLHVLEAWRTDADFRRWFNGVLAGVKYRAFRWETPPVTSSNLEREFEMVLLDYPALDRKADPASFAGPFRALGPGERVATFPNLGNNALLVVPRPLGAAAAYGHLAAFVRQAPEAQRDDFWKAVGHALEARLGADPVWLSTAGMGVPWLHVRLDSLPKYYGYLPYTTPP